MTRHQRRKLARSRKDAKAELLNSRALCLLQSEKAKANLSQPWRGKRTPKGLVSSIYGGAPNSMGFTRRDFRQLGKADLKKSGAVSGFTAKAVKRG